MADAGDQGPPSREELVRALRHANMLVTNLGEQVVRLEARVGALVDLLLERAVVEGATLDAQSTEALLALQLGEAKHPGLRVDLGELVDKYTEPSPPVPCAELIPLCGARCCAMTFPLTTQDLNQGIVRWDVARPYRILQRDSDGYCTHSDPATRACGVYHDRPRTCRSFDCRNDRRIWHDYERRIPADAVPAGEEPREPNPRTPSEVREALLRKVRAREIALTWETRAVQDLYDERNGSAHWRIGQRK